MRAVLERDFLCEARRPRAFLARTVIGGIAAAVLLFHSTAGWETLRDAPDRIGAAVFSILGTATFLFVAILTPTLVVGTILAERRQNTLPILLASPVTGLDLALGKFLSRTGTILVWTSAALPPLVITLLFGGVSARQAADLALTIFGTVLELGAWGLLVSAVFRRLATAALFVYFVPLLHWAAASGLSSWWAARFPVSWTLAAVTTPLPTIFASGSGLLPGRPPLPTGLPGLPGFLAGNPGLAYLLFSTLLAAACVVISGRLLAREEELRGGASRRRPGPALERRLRRRLTGGNPVAWKESLLLNAAGSRLLYYTVGALLVAGAVVFLALHASGDWSADHNFHFLWIEATVLALLASVTGAASMAQEKSQGSLDLLRISLLTPGEIARGKILGLAVGLGWLLLLPLGHLAIASLGGYSHPVAALLAAVALGVFVAAHLVVGVHWGTVSWAPWAALAGAVALPAFGFLGCTLCCTIPLLITVVNMAKGNTRSALESVALPGILIGPAFLSVGMTPGALHAVLTGGGFRGGADDSSAIFGAIFLALQAILVLRYWRSLPGVLRKEMARVSEGDAGDPRGLAAYRIPRPVRDYGSRPTTIRFSGRKRGKGRGEGEGDGTGTGEGAP